MKLGIFYSSVIDIHKAPQKQLLMDIFKEGAAKCGDIIYEYRTKNQNIEKLDAGFVLGYTLENNYRKKIINTLKSMNAKIIFVDSNIFTYSFASHRYHRYSVNSVYPTDGEYFLGNSINPKKLYTILDEHKISVKPWRENGNHILILGQRTLSWNMLNNNGLEWIISMIFRVKEKTDRKIIVRLHPGDHTFNASNKEKILEVFKNKNVFVSSNESLQSDLKDAWCSVGYNSTPNCASVIEGVPVYLDNDLNSWAKEMAFTDLNQLENPPMPERNEWLNKIANIHWSNDEIRSGIYWKNFKNFYKF